MRSRRDRERALARLDQIEGQIEATDYKAGLTLMEREAAALSFVDTGTPDALLALARSILARHYDYGVEDDPRHCHECGWSYPCDDVEAVYAALGIEEEGVGDG